MKNFFISIFLLASLATYSQVKIDGVTRYPALWIYSYDLEAADKIKIDNLNAEIVRLNALLSTPVPPPVVVPPSSNTVIFNGAINTASVTKITDWWSIQPWLTDIKKAGFESIGTVGPSTFTSVEKVLDGGVSVIKAKIIGTDPNDAARFQTSTYFLSKDYGIYHHTQRMKIGSEVSAITNYPEIITAKSGGAWFTIFETWMGQSVSRINVSLYKEKGVGKPILWQLQNEWEEGSSTPYRTIWEAPLSTIPIPFGKWFTMDVFIKSGEGANGQVKIIITVDGEAPITLFDIKNTTTSPGMPSVFRRKTDHMKFYIGGTLRKYMLNNNKALEVSYGDYKIFKD